MTDDRLPEYVPSVAELAHISKDFAYPVSWVKGEKKNDPPRPTKWHITPLGHAYLGDVMRRNAELAIELGEGDWVQPPSTFTALPVSTTSDPENLELNGGPNAS
jgi:hypothetical protein